MISFEKSNPEEQKIDSTILENFKKKLKNEHISGCMVMRHENIVFEFYKNNKVEPSLHGIHSCTKSFVSALVGVCIKNGLIYDVHMPIAEFFGDLVLNQSDQRKQEITIYHLLTMSAGFDWPEFGEWQFFSPMEYSKDIINFIIGRELESNPGEKMNYNSGCSHLLSAIVQKASGKQASELARQYLFKPLGINDTHWYEKQKVNLGANGLKLKLLDMLKFGYLFLKEGTLQGNEIIPKEWVKESTTPRFMTYPDIGHYGYQWWISSIHLNENSEIPFYFALGLFGQYIIVIPQYDMVVVFTSENYSDTMKPLHYFREYIAKAVREQVLHIRAGRAVRSRIGPLRGQA